MAPLPKATEQINWAKAPMVAERQFDGVISPSIANSLRRWKSQSPFDQDDYFHRRLELEGLDEDSL